MWEQWIAEDTILRWGAISAALTAVLIFWRRIGQGIARQWRHLREALTMLAEIAESRDLLHKIWAELKPNGGKSLRDSVDRQEERQIAQGELLQTLMSTLSIAYFKTDKEGHITWVNRAMLRLLNAVPHEVIGSGWVNFIEQPDRAEIKELWDEAIKSGREFDYLTSLHRPGEKPLPVRIHTLVMRRPDSNELLGMMGTMRPES